VLEVAVVAVVEVAVEVVGWGDGALRDHSIEWTGWKMPIRPRTEMKKVDDRRMISAAGEVLP
jgi:hypothetical protein